jgi:hypothetical protein
MEETQEQTNETPEVTSEVVEQEVKSFDKAEAIKKLKELEVIFKEGYHLSGYNPIFSQIHKAIGNLTYKVLDEI